MNVASVIALVLCLGADVATTEVGRAREGFREANPVVRDQAVFLGLSSAMMAGAVGAYVVAGGDEWPSWVSAGLLAGAALRCGAAGWNAHVLSQ